MDKSWRKFGYKKAKQWVVAGGEYGVSEGLFDCLFLL